jgi:purine-binding chemotaxis protein CheW
MEAGEAEDTHRRIVILQYGEDWVGFVVDSVREVRWLPSGSITADPHMMEWCGEQFVSGVAQIGSDLVILLTVDRLLTGTEHKRLSRLAKRAPGGADKAA